MLPINIFLNYFSSQSNKTHGIYPSVILLTTHLKFQRLCIFFMPLFKKEFEYESLLSLSLINQGSHSYYLFLPGKRSLTNYNSWCSPEAKFPGTCSSALAVWSSQNGNWIFHQCLLPLQSSNNQQNNSPLLIIQWWAA